MKSVTKGMSRRKFIETGAGCATAVTACAILGSRLAAAGGHLPKLDPDSTQAKTFKYVHASTTDGQWCSNCQLFQGGAKEWGECAIFPGKEVAAKGWCTAWVKKTT